MPVTSTTHTVDLSPGLPFCVLGNRYQTDLPRAEGYTLILLHATGLHKETFEPLIHALFETSQAATNTVGPKAGASIREIWTIGRQRSCRPRALPLHVPPPLDCPNHGESAVLNHDVLGRDYADNCQSAQPLRMARLTCFPLAAFRGWIFFCSLCSCIPDVQAWWRELAAS